jgi:Fe-S cluster assembly protein SufD
MLYNDASFQDVLKFDNHSLIIDKKSNINEPVEIKLTPNQKFDIVVSNDAQLSLIIHIEDDQLSALNYEFSLKTLPYSQVKLVILSNLKSEDAQLRGQIDVQTNSHLNVIGSFLSNQLDAKLWINLNGEGAEAKMNAIAVSSAQHNQNIDVHMTHFAPYSFGDMYNIGIANEKGKVVLNGVEKIEQGMKQANAFQTLKGVILSDLAVVEVNPILLIDEYDVKAGHGATIGKLEEEQLYYLQSRGLTKNEAEKLIINGYIRPILDQIGVESISETIETKIYERLT